MSGNDPLDAMFGAESEPVREVPEAQSVTQETAPEPQPEPKPTEAKDTPRDERGRFAPKADGEQPQEAQPIEGEERGYVPLTALQKVRDESKRLKAELAELKQRYGSPQQQAPQQFQPQQPQYQEDIPPEVRIQHEMRNQILHTHELIAKRAYGRELVDEAKSWFEYLREHEPDFAYEIANDPAPYETLVEHYRAQQKVGAIQALMQQGFDPTNPIPWAEQVLRARQAQQQQAQPAPQQPSRPPPRSLASQPSSGGQDAVPTGPGQAFDSLFTR